MTIKTQGEKKKTALHYDDDAWQRSTAISQLEQTLSFHYSLFPYVENNQNHNPSHATTHP